MQFLYTLYMYLNVTKPHLYIVHVFSIYSQLNPGIEIRVLIGPTQLSFVLFLLNECTQLFIELMVLTWSESIQLLFF